MPKALILLNHAVSEEAGMKWCADWLKGFVTEVPIKFIPAGEVVRAFPTLLDRGDSVSLRVVDNEGLQERAMRGGVRRLLLMSALQISNDRHSTQVFTIVRH